MILKRCTTFERSVELFLLEGFNLFYSTNPRPTNKFMLSFPLEGKRLVILKLGRSIKSNRHCTIPGISKIVFITWWLHLCNQIIKQARMGTECNIYDDNNNRISCCIYVSQVNIIFTRIMQIMQLWTIHNQGNKLIVILILALLT